MSTAAVAASSASSNVTPPSGGKRLVKSKSGLKIVCQHDRESAPWDMAEPQWTPDKEVYTTMTNKQIIWNYIIFIVQFSLTLQGQMCEKIDINDVLF